MQAIREPGPPAFIEQPWLFWAGIAWGFAEATLFFIVPDVLFTLVAPFSFRRSGKLIAFILLGALTGGTVMFFLGAKNPTQAKPLVLHVPFVSETMFAKTHAAFQRDGLWALAKAPGNGIPYKVYCVQASQYAGWPAFIAISLLARLERFVPNWLFACFLGLAFRKQIRRRPQIVTIVHACLWTLGYAVYWNRI